MHRILAFNSFILMHIASLGKITLDFWYYLNYNLTVSGRIGRPRTGRKPNFSIRINPDALQQARSAVTNRKKTLGQWLEEAIREKIQREQRSKSDKEVNV